MTQNSNDTLDINTKQNGNMHKGHQHNGSKINVIPIVASGNTKGGRITVPLTSCLTGLDLVCFANKNKNCLLSYS
jgi:hypothetical protein